jgi:ferredoxin
MSPAQDDAVTVGVDMVRCAGHGICAWLLPERIGLDEWGFAHVDGQPVTGRSDRRRARRAERACPKKALLVTPVPPARPTV